MHVWTSAFKGFYYTTSIGLLAGKQKILLPPQEFCSEAKSRGGIPVVRAYIVLTVKVYSMYTRSNLDLLKQGAHGING